MSTQRKSRLPDFRTMRFENKGQDFLWWTIDRNGVVVGCGPFQGSTWTKCTVVNHRTLKAGDKPIFTSRVLREKLTLNYRIEAIWEGFDHMEPKASVVRPAAKPLKKKRVDTAAIAAARSLGYGAKIVPLLVLLFVLPLAAFASETFTERAFTRADMIVAFTQLAPKAPAAPKPDACQFAVIRRSELADVTATVRRTLNKTYGVGVNIVTNASGWNERWDCTAFAMAFELELRARLMRELWHSNANVQRPACCYLAFKRDASGGKGHAILFLVTDSGPCFWDPVIGEVTLSPTEIASIYYPQI